jgi:hypothetical protein
MNGSGGIFPTIIGLKLPVVKARVPKQKRPREWRVGLKILGGHFSCWWTKQRDDSELAFDDAQSKKQWAYRREMISEERQNTLSLDLCVPILSDSFDILLKICGEPVAESPNASTLPPPIVASLALQHPPVVELPVTQQLPCIQLNTQPPSVENSPMQQGVALLVPTYASSNLWRTRMTWLLLCVLLVSCAVIPIVIQTLSLSSHHLHRANKFSNASVG